MTISKFERILVEVRGRSDLKGKIEIPQSAFEALGKYETAKKESLDELSAFRQAYSITAAVTVPEVTSLDDLLK